MPMEQPSDKQAMLAQLENERTVELFVPGRICLMGEHSDWAGSYRRFNSKLLPGMCLVSGTNQGLYARACRHPSKLIVTSIDQAGNTAGPIEFPMEPAALLSVAEAGGHFSYVAGVAYQILVRYHVSGLVLHNYLTDLPARKGLSSSAAACVLTARAFNRVYDLKLTVRGEMDLGYHGEITTPSQCGRMDQCCAFGNRPVLMTFDGDRLDCDELNLKCTIHLVIVELDGRKDTTKILQTLTKCYPVPDNEAEAGVHELLGPANQRIVRAAMRALDTGDLQALGLLMDEAQSLFDRYAMPVCPSQLTAPNLHRVLGHAPLRKHIWGAKGVGSQGDGCAQLLCKSREDMEAAIALVERELGMAAMPLQIGAAKPVTQAVIPAAAFSAASFPASHTTPPALFPVLDADGFLKPALLVLVEQAVDAGVSTIAIVVSPDHRSDFETLFHRPPTVREMQRMPDRQQQYAAKIKELGDKVVLVEQAEPLGLGHALLCARPALSDSAPLLIILGDHLYASTHTTGASCLKQLLAAYTGTSLMALQRTRVEEVHRYGCVAGTWEQRPAQHSRTGAAAGDATATGAAIDARTEIDADTDAATAIPPTDPMPARHNAEHHPEHPSEHPPAPGGGRSSGGGLASPARLAISSLVEKPSGEAARSSLRVPGLPDGTFLTAFGLYLVASTGGLMRSLDGLLRARGDSPAAPPLQLTEALNATRIEGGLHGVLLHGERCDIGGEPQTYLRAIGALARAAEGGAGPA